MAFVVMTLLLRGVVFTGGHSRFSGGGVFEGIGGAQRFAFRAQTPRQQTVYRADARGPFPAAIDFPEDDCRSTPDSELKR